MYYPIEFTDEQRRNGWALIDALRSGEFRQGNGRLCFDDGHAPRDYCCLGVACELERRKAPEKYAWSPPRCHGEVVFEWKNAFGEQVGEGYYLPQQFHDDYGMNGQSGTFQGVTFYPDGDDYGGTGSLAGLNDDRVPFSVIADELEKVYGPRP